MFIKLLSYFKYSFSLVLPNGKRMTKCKWNETSCRCWQLLSWI